MDSLAAFARAFAETVLVTAARAPEEEEGRKSPGSKCALVFLLRFACDMGVNNDLGGGAVGFSRGLRISTGGLYTGRVNFSTPEHDDMHFFKNVSRRNSKSSNASTTPDSSLEPPQ